MQIILKSGFLPSPLRAGSGSQGTLMLAPGRTEELAIIVQGSRFDIRIV